VPPRCSHALLSQPLHTLPPVPASLLLLLAAAAARWFPLAIRSRCTSSIYSAFSVGTVVGLGLTPAVAQHVGWGSTFALFGLAGMAAAAVGSLMLPEERGRAGAQQAGRGAKTPGPAGKQRTLGREALAHMGLLCFTHSVIR